MKRSLAGMSPPQPSQRTTTASPIRNVPTIASGTKKRTLTLPGGSSATTGAPACTNSPGRYSVSVTRPATGAACAFCATRHCACASASRAAFASACAAAISSVRAGRFAIRTCSVNSATRARAIARGLRLVALLRRDELVGDELLGAREIGLALAQRRLRLGELRARGGDFRRASRLLQIRERRLGLPHPGLCLGLRRTLLVVLQREERRALRNLFAARN